MADDKPVNDGLSAADRIRMKKLQNNTVVRDTKEPNKELTETKKAP